VLLSAAGPGRPQLVVGFAAETHDVLACAAAKFAREGCTVIDSPGTVDSDHRGSLIVCLVDLEAEAFSIMWEDRIAQVVIVHAP